MKFYNINVDSHTDMLVLLSGILNELVQHGLRALRETLPTEQDLTTKVPQLPPHPPDTSPPYTLS